MRSRFVIIASLVLVGTALSGCGYGHPGHDSDRYGHHHHGDRDHDRDHDRYH